ncbi:MULTISPECIES: TetR/AcrR family transcriptional regulator [Weissella]|uniref:Transcription regulator of multidrug efflux pump operon, TetR (AcrR) family n=2 Tax=Weissella TaxID=46255 RepID=A0A1L6RAX9_9LACO|nr:MULTISPECIES: TetR/AcrR family transcriptional regulator [Weissella]APS41694.1 Transcription regulator of multidrug efflux pump operon, TetR (AcrR) family [Weissella jogaejeotgali]NKY90528.1 TetR/AcrR family transcriptional regulator [Weissella thailandensis]RDS60089.1 TetR/AcrR family transcriptional regulator [Weissella thailandensis]GEP73818.1 hypothetical protein WTH01_00650 [Weissella thailandensis]HJG84787.1 TetR/AcrR family transcriptional regulator [Weissella thailandensis]
MRQRDENKISALSEAAIDLVAEQGIINLSINKMAKRAGVSVATAYVYYDNKADLLGKLFQQVQNLLINNMTMPAADLPIKEQFADILRQYAARFKNNVKEVEFLAAMLANPQFLPAELQNSGSLLNNELLAVITQAYRQRLLVTGSVDLIVAQTIQPMQWLLQSRIQNGLTVSDAEVEEFIVMATGAIFK